MALATPRSSQRDFFRAEGGALPEFGRYRQHVGRHCLGQVDGADGAPSYFGDKLLQDFLGYFLISSQDQAATHYVQPQVMCRREMPSDLLPDRSELAERPASECRDTGYSAA
jgi:hypothetical protein